MGFSVWVCYRKSGSERKSAVVLKSLLNDRLLSQILFIIRFCGITCRNEHGTSKNNFSVTHKLWLQTVQTFLMRELLLMQVGWVASHPLTVESFSSVIFLWETERFGVAAKFWNFFYLRNNFWGISWIIFKNCLVLF